MTIMIVIVQQHNARQYAGLLNQMFQLRARVFHDRLRWRVQVVDGMERDKYDREDPVYVLYTDPDQRRLIGSLRLLPTTGPTLVADYFADTVPDSAGLTSPEIWECTRFCVDEDYLGNGNREELVFASGVLFAALGEIAIESGIRSILGNFDSRMLRLYRRVGCEVEVLGSTERYGPTVYLGSFPVSSEILHRLMARLRIARSPLAESRDQPAIAA
jgi:N-acyl-L-homoserine lactone synthetase